MISHPETEAKKGNQLTTQSFWKLKNITSTPYYFKNLFTKALKKVTTSLQWLHLWLQTCSNLPNLPRTEKSSAGTPETSVVQPQDPSCWRLDLLQNEFQQLFLFWWVQNYPILEKPSYTEQQHLHAFPATFLKHKVYFYLLNTLKNCRGNNSKGTIFLIFLAKTFLLRSLQKYYDRNKIIFNSSTKALLAVKILL